MANKIKGEVALKAGDGDYTLRFSANALCEMEDALGIGINAVATTLGDPANMRIKMVRTILWAALRDHHAEVTPVKAGEILDEASLPVAMEAISKAFELAFEDRSKARPTEAPRQNAKSAA